MLELNYRDPRPIYQQLKDRLRQLILSGAVAPGEKLPSVRDLAADLAVNPNTIQRAYRELEAEGFLNSVPGKGSFAAPISEVEDSRIQGLLETFAAAGRELLQLGVPKEELIEKLEVTAND